jgi:hypothetical protein
MQRFSSDCLQLREFTGITDLQNDRQAETAEILQYLESRRSGGQKVRTRRDFSPTIWRHRECLLSFHYYVFVRRM